MSVKPIRLFGPTIRALAREIAAAPGPQITRIVALVDALRRRGPADQLIEPLRHRLARLRPPRPLRFDRLLFNPLDLVIVPAAGWRPGQDAIPRTALMPIAEHVRLALGPLASEIGAAIAGRSTADTELISQLGRSLWPVSARILAETEIPDSWASTELGNATYRPLAGVVATLLTEAAGVDTLRAEIATGMLPPAPEVVQDMLYRVAVANRAALPMMIAVLLERVPEAEDLLPRTPVGAAAIAVRAAMDAAADLLLQQLDHEEGTERRIAPGSLTDAGGAVNRIATLLLQLETATAKPPRRERLRAVRRRLDAGCKERFAAGLQDELLSLLQPSGAPLDPAVIDALEAAARGLRVLDAAGRAITGGAYYDRMLAEAAETIKDYSMRDRLTLADQLRLVEILSGSDAALAMLDAQV